MSDSEGESAATPQRVTDEFVVEHAVEAEDAESYVHIGLDDHYHPTGGYWVPTGKTWHDVNVGVVSEKSDIPQGEMVQYPCSEREPERIGHDELPDWAVNLRKRGDDR